MSTFNSIKCDMHLQGYFRLNALIIYKCFDIFIFYFISNENIVICLFGNYCIYDFFIIKFHQNNLLALLFCSSGSYFMANKYY